MLMDWDAIVCYMVRFLCEEGLKLTFFLIAHGSSTLVSCSQPTSCKGLISKQVERLKWFKVMLKSFVNWGQFHGAVKRSVLLSMKSLACVSKITDQIVE